MITISTWDSHGCSISVVPSVAPKRVVARSVSAVQIEVVWEALRAIPERVLGYEVCISTNYFSLLSGLKHFPTGLSLFVNYTVCLLKFTYFNTEFVIIVHI